MTLQPAQGGQRFAPGRATTPTLGARESGTERLEEAIDAYRAALEVFTDEGNHAIVQDNLARALNRLRERGS